MPKKIICENESKSDFFEIGDTFFTSGFDGVYPEGLIVGSLEEITTLKDKVSVLDGEVIDASVMEKTALINFLKEQVKDAKDKGILFSLHMKATMMKG